MSFTDKNISCVECENTFVFTAQEQELYQQRGFLNEPKRCAPCRSARKAKNGGQSGFGGASAGERFSATCADCGREASLPFRPRGDRPVYCSDCFRNRRG
jgi:CxxC-x17-CxxC domain-containing protein